MKNNGYFYTYRLTDQLWIIQLWIIIFSHGLGSMIKDEAVSIF